MTRVAIYGRELGAYWASTYSFWFVFLVDRSMSFDSPMLLPECRCVCKRLDV